MAVQKVEFQFITGLKRSIFRNPRLRGSWDGNGKQQPLLPKQSFAISRYHHGRAHEASWSDRSPDAAVMGWDGERRFLKRHDCA
jgi:hypothetical protein